uniref:Secreted protein n=1 Tax=Panagrolaimus superbus TaxID=310955 RepID=A0A914Z0S0_9BILA
MKHARACLAIAAALTLAAPFAASAQENESPYSWNVTAVSDYLFRGVSQTDEKPTLQAGFTYTSPVGLYAGVWGSGVDFGPGDPNTEIDYQIGLRRGRHFARQLRQLVTTTTLDDTYKLTVAYTNDQWNSGTDGWYYGVGGQWGLPQDFTLNANVGRSSFEKGLAKDYTDWNVGVSRQFGLFNVGLGYYGTDGNGRENSGKLAHSRVLLTVAIGK